MMLFDDERRSASVKDEAKKGQNPTNHAISKLKRLSSIAIDLEQMGHRADATIGVFWRSSFFVPIGVSAHEAIATGDYSMIDVIGIPIIREALESQMDRHGDEMALVQRLLPTSAADLMKLTRNQQEDLETLQFGESSLRYRNGILQRAYLRAGGRRDFEGSYAWGLVDHNATNFSIDREAGSLEFLVRIGTILPHVRYECRFNSAFMGATANVHQSLKVNPRVALVTQGVDEWFRKVVTQVTTPSQ